MRRWLPLLLAAMLALGCAGCTKRQTVTVYRIETGGTALLHPETVTVPGGTDRCRSRLMRSAQNRATARARTPCATG